MSGEGFDFGAAAESLFGGSMNQGDETGGVVQERPQSRIQPGAKPANQGMYHSTADAGELEGGGPLTDEAMGELLSDYGMEKNEMTDTFMSVVEDYGLNREQAGQLLEMNKQHNEAVFAQAGQAWHDYSVENFSSEDLGEAREILTDVAEYLSPQTIAILDSPYGNHPALIELVLALGRR